MASCPPLKYNRKYNFSAGPSALPEEVLETARDELLNYHGVGASVMELSHRSKEFIAIAEQAEADYRELMGIPNNYKVLFLAAGAVGEFAAVPLNLGCVGDDKVADYIVSGQWSDRAVKEAKNFCKVNIAGTSNVNGAYTSAPKDWNLSENSEYVWYCDNETVHGVQYHDTPYVPPNKLLVCDMSSSMLSKKIDVSKYAIIMGGAQKNAGPAGVTIVVVREDLVVKGRAHKHTPEALHYFVQSNEGSMRNTPPTFPWYMCGLTFKYLKAHGGVEYQEKHHDYLSSKLYNFIDDNHFYKDFVVKEYRSKINVPFTFSFNNEELEATFLKEAGKAGMMNLKGYKTMGGFRASMYNAMPDEGVDALVSFMSEFQDKHADKAPK
jgi:phosphoserine aminotransferase